jgi:hypothetical protein
MLESFELKADNQWFRPWKRRGLLWFMLALLIMMMLQFPFVFFFDTMLTNIGFLYTYFWALPQAVILYFVAFKLRVPWVITFMMLVTGLVGAPIDYYFEWIVQRNLVAPIYAFMWIPLYAVTGLIADVTLMKLHPEKAPIRASLLSAFAFTAAVIATTIFGTYILYPTGLTLDVPWIKQSAFLLPYSLITGTIGGYLGYSLARDIKVSFAEHRLTG